MSNRVRASICKGLLLSPLFALLCFAQFSSSVQGVIRDPSGAGVANAAVTLLNSATQVSQETKSDNVGDYRFVSLAPGSYTISAQAPGFVRRT